MRFITGILLLASLAATFAHAQTLPTFQHIIVIIQENRTPDNLFGSSPTFVPGVDIQQPAQGQWCLGACFNPDHSHAPGWENMWNYKGQGWNNGQGVCHNSFGKPGDCGNGSSTITYCNAEIVNHDLNVPTCPQETYVSAGYDTSVVQPYFDIATKYGFANYFFQSNQGPSMPAHQFLFTGTSSPSGVVNQGYWNYYQAENPALTGDTGCTASTSNTVQLVDKSGSENGDPAIFPCFNHNSLPTLLDNAVPQRVTWRYYGSTQPGSSSPSGIWTAPNAVYDICLPLNGTHTVCTGYDWVNDVVFGTSQILHDLGAVSYSECAAQQVSWVVPNGDRSDHPGFQGNENDSHQIEGGPSWVADIINTLGNDPGKCGYWNNTAVFVVWDDWGGWWDHVQPYEVLYDDQAHNHPCDPAHTFGCGYVSGFRVPFLVVSPYTGTLKNGVYSGYVSGACGAPPLPQCPDKVFPYVHDFGSILAFIENNFLGFNQIGQINPTYKFADNFAPDFKPQPPHVPLADFFPLYPTPRPFQAITLPPGAPSATDFINYNGPILDPDNDAVDND